MWEAGPPQLMLAMTEFVWVPCFLGSSQAITYGQIEGYGRGKRLFNTWRVVSGRFTDKTYWPFWFSLTYRGTSQASCPSIHPQGTIHELSHFSVIYSYLWGLPACRNIVILSLAPWSRSVGSVDSYRSLDSFLVAHTRPTCGAERWMIEIKLFHIAEYSNREVSLYQLMSKKVIMQQKLRKFKSSIAPSNRARWVIQAGAAPPPNHPVTSHGQFRLTFSANTLIGAKRSNKGTNLLGTINVWLSRLSHEILVHNLSRR